LFGELTAPSAAGLIVLTADGGTPWPDRDDRAS
jgi:hypothetical protein